METFLGTCSRLPGCGYITCSSSGGTEMRQEVQLTQVDFHSDSRTVTLPGCICDHEVEGVGPLQEVENMQDI